MARAIVCPAGSPLNPAAGVPSVLCGELHIRNTGSIKGFTDRAHVSPVMHGDRDRTAVATYCEGPGIPGSICSYTACPIWQAAREADWARRKGPDSLRDGQAARPPAGVRERLLELAEMNA